MSIMNKDIIQRIAILANLNNLQPETLLHQTELIVLAKHQFLAMAHIDGILLPTLLIVNTLMRTVVEDDTILKYLTNSCPLMLIGCLQNLHCTLRISSNSTGKEMSASTETQLCGTERILYRTIGA